MHSPIRRIVVCVICCLYYINITNIWGMCMFSRFEATFTSSDFFTFNFCELSELIRNIPGLEPAELNPEKISCLCSPQGLAVELSLPGQGDYLLCLYDMREFERARWAWDFAMYSSALVDKICKKPYSDNSFLSSARFSCVNQYSYVLMPVKKGRPLSEMRQQEDFLQVLLDFVLLSSIPVSLKKESRLSFVDIGRDKDMFFRDFKTQFRRAEEHFFNYRELRGMPVFLKKSKHNLRRSRYLINTMQMSRYTMSGIHRLKDGTLHLSKPLCLEYSIIDINLCDLLDLFHEAKDTVKSLLVHVYYNLQVPLQFFNLYALYNFIQIIDNWKLPYSDYCFEKIFDDLLKYKAAHSDFKTCIPQWYQEPVVFPQLQENPFNSNVTVLYLWEHIKEIML